MRTGIIGAGRIGSTLARLLVGAGHQVRLANASGPARLAALLDELGPAASAGTPDEAVEQSELIVLMLPFAQGRELPLGPIPKGKVLVDAMNAFPPLEFPAGRERRASSELVAAGHPGARLVKSFNTMHFATLGEAAGRTGDNRLTHFVAGDDAAAKSLVSSLVSELGFVPLDTGSLHEGGILQEPGGPLFNTPLTEQQAVAVLGS